MRRSRLCGHALAALPLPFRSRQGTGHATDAFLQIVAVDRSSQCGADALDALARPLGEGHDSSSIDQAVSAAEGVIERARRGSGGRDDVVDAKAALATGFEQRDRRVDEAFDGALPSLTARAGLHRHDDDVGVASMAPFLVDRSDASICTGKGLWMARPRCDGSCASATSAQGGPP